MAIYRGIGGAGDSTTDATVTAVTEKATEAASSASSAATSASSASTSASNASTSATNASNSASNASTSETNASNSASAASTSASNASTSETNAAASASAASTSETNAAASESAASTSETNAATSETNAATSETNASNSATAASTSASNAATSESNASTSETNAATSATNAATSETNAQTAADTALSALDNFDDRYLGQKTSDPTLDNDGDALVAGALYFNTTDDVMKVYDGSVWVAAYASLSGTLVAVNNLSDVASASVSRTNLGLGTAATTASTDYATAAQGALADSALQNLVEDTTPQLGGDLASNGNDINFGDNDKANFGADSDLQIYHTGGASVIRDSGTGSLYIDGSSEIFLRGQSGFSNMIKAIDGAQVELYHNNSPKLSTTATGVDVTGTITTDGLTTSGDINFGDADKAIFGAGSDLQIYHDGSNSFIDDAGTGALVIRSNEIQLQKYTGETLASFIADGTVQLRYDNAAKLATTATGVNVTGTVTATTDAVGTTAGDEKDFALFECGASDVRLRDIRHTDGTTWTTTETRLHYSVDDNASKQMWLSFYNPDNVTTDNVIRFGEGDNNEWVRIDNGNVGIGTSSPSTALDVNGTINSSTGALTLNGSNFSNTTYTGSSVNLTGVYTGLDSGGGYVVNVRDSGYIGLSTSNAERMRIDSSGNVGIGTTSFNYGKLEVAGSGYVPFAIRSTDGVIAYLAANSSSEVRMGAISNHPLSIRTNGAERMRITSSGNVGIGTATPASKMHIDTPQSSSVANLLTLRDSSAGTTFNLQTYADPSYGTANRFDYNGTYLAFRRSGSEAMRIDSSGNVGIGTTSPTYKFQVAAGTNHLITKASSNLNGNIFFDTQNTSTGASAAIVQRFITSNVAGTGTTSADFQKTKAGALNINNNETNSAAYTAFGVGGSEAMRIKSNGNVGIGDSSPDVALDVVGSIYYTGTITDVSDRRLKENVLDLSDSLNKVCQLNAKSYTLIADRDNEEEEVELGFIAQEVQTVFPEVVKNIQKYVVDENGEDTEEEINYLGVSYIQLVAPMVEAIKELKTEVDILKAKVTALEAANGS